MIIMPRLLHPSHNEIVLLSEEYEGKKSNKHKYQASGDQLIMFSEQNSQSSSSKTGKTHSRITLYSHWKRVAVHTGGAEAARHLMNRYTYSTYAIQVNVTSSARAKLRNYFFLSAKMH